MRQKSERSPTRHEEDAGRKVASQRFRLDVPSQSRHGIQVNNSPLSYAGLFIPQRRTSVGPAARADLAAVISNRDVQSASQAGGRRRIGRRSRCRADQPRPMCRAAGPVQTAIRVFVMFNRSAIAARPGPASPMASNCPSRSSIRTVVYGPGRADRIMPHRRSSRPDWGLGLGRRDLTPRLRGVRRSCAALFDEISTNFSATDWPRRSGSPSCDAQAEAFWIQTAGQGHASRRSCIAETFADSCNRNPSLSGSSWCWFQTKKSHTKNLNSKLCTPHSSPAWWSVHNWSAHPQTTNQP